jgi:hypothetical protein
MRKYTDEEIARVIHMANVRAGYVRSADPRARMSHMCIA